MHVSTSTCACNIYLVALVSRIDKIIDLFCKRALSKRLCSSKETYDFIDPTLQPLHTRMSSAARDVHLYCFSNIHLYICIFIIYQDIHMYVYMHMQLKTIQILVYWYVHMWQADCLAGGSGVICIIWHACLIPCIFITYASSVVSSYQHA